MASTTEKILILKSSDGEDFEIEQKAAVLSQTIKNMVEDDCSSGTIPLPNVDSKTLSVVIEYCKRHAAEADKADAKDEEDALKTFDKELVDEKNQKLLFDMILAANYLNIKGLLDMLCQKVADMMKGKTPEQIRETFHIKNDYTPEEEEEIRRENAWAFE